MGIKTKRIKQIIVIFLFIVALLFPWANKYIHIFENGINYENRALTNKPEFTFETIDSFPKQYDRYYNDQFGMRNFLNNSISMVYFELFKYSLNPKEVVIGKNGKAFRNRNLQYYYFDRKHLTPEEKEAIRNELSSRALYYNKLNIKYVWVFIPTKGAIYENELPKYFKGKRDSVTITDEFVEILKSIPSISIIELEEYLKTKKDEENIFYKTDHHWNGHGAILAYQNIIEQLNNKDNSIGLPYKRNEFNISRNEFTGNLSGMLGYISKKELSVNYEPKEHCPMVTGFKNKSYPVEYGFYAEEYFIGARTEQKHKKKALFIRDSFTYPMLVALSMHFRESIFLWDAWKFGFNQHIIENEKPDYVIHLISDGMLMPFAQRCMINSKTITSSFETEYTSDTILSNEEIQFAFNAHNRKNITSFSGDYSLQLDKNDSKNAIIRLDREVNIKQVFVKLFKKPLNSKISIYCKIPELGYEEEMAIEKEIEKKDWQQVEANFILPPNHKHNKIWLYVEWKGGDRVFVDDMSIEIKK